MPAERECCKKKWKLILKLVHASVIIIIIIIFVDFTIKFRLKNQLVYIILKSYHGKPYKVLITGFSLTDLIYIL